MGVLVLQRHGLDRHLVFSRAPGFLFVGIVFGVRGCSECMGQLVSLLRDVMSRASKLSNEISSQCRSRTLNPKP